jgi:hypothetical protein
MCWRTMISGYLMLPVLILPASRAIATVGNTPHRYTRAVVLSFSFGIMIVAKGGQALRSRRVMGWNPYCPQVPRVKKSGDALSSVTASYPPVSFLFRIAGITKPGLSPIYQHNDLQCFVANAQLLLSCPCPCISPSYCR